MIKTASLIVAVVASLLVVGCGNGDAPASGTTGGAATAGATGAATSSGPAAAAPKGKSITAKFCLGADGTSQDCGICCKVDKDSECCAKWEEKTKAICAKITKAQCQEICEKDENPTACEIAKTMK